MQAGVFVWPSCDRAAEGLEMIATWPAIGHRAARFAPYLDAHTGQVTIDRRTSMSANTLATSGGGTDTPQAARIAGLLGGCNILTIQGYKPIEDLAYGDRIITRSGLRMLTGITNQTEDFAAISVKSGSLGFNRPATDMKIAPHQDVMVRDWRAEVLFDADTAIVPLNQLCDGTYIVTDATSKPHLVYRLHFDQQEVFYADGVEIVSQFDAAATPQLDIADAA